jgi:hypothetical protein
MPSFRSFLLCAVSFAIAPSLSTAQQSKKAWKVDVQPAAEMLPGNVVRMTYRVTVAPTSRYALSGFAVKALSPVTRIVTPEPPQNWAAFTKFGTEQVASWSALGLRVAAGQSTPPLVYEAVGIPGIVRYSALRDAPPSNDVTDDPPDAKPHKSTGAQIFRPGLPNRTTGATVGVMPLPQHVTNENVAQLLRKLVGSARQLGWVSDVAVYRDLRARGLPNAAALRAFIQTLDAERGKHVSESGYALLRGNAEYLLGRL